MSAYADAIHYWYPTETNDYTDSVGGLDGTPDGVTSIVDDTEMGGSKAFNFGASNQAGKIRVAEKTSPPLWDLPAWTISTWAKQNTIVATVLWGQWEATGQKARLNFSFTSSGELRLSGRQTGTEAFTVFAISSPLVRNDTWHMYTAVFESGGRGVELLEDGVIVGQAALGSQWTNNSVKCDIGSLNTTLGQGDMDRLALWSRALSASEITELYALQRDPSMTITPSRTFHPLAQGF